MENPHKKIKIESENDFENSSESQQENFLSDQKVKKDPEGNFLFLPFESLKMPKSIKGEVTKKEIKAGGKSTKFSDFQCKICQKYFCNTRTLNRHTELHYQPSSFECKKCEKTWELKHKFDAHKCVEKSEKHFCTFCEKIFLNVSTLTKHVKKFHSDKLKVDLFSCDFCDEKFITKGKLKNHLERFKCRIKKIFTCDHCGKEFDEKRKISQHVQSHKKFKVECEICYAQVKAKNLSEHMKKVHIDKTFECKICKKLFKTFRHLRVHQTMHEAKQFSCQFCERKFPTQGHLNFHMKFHENPDQFKCQICGHQSKEKGTLKYHLRTHDKNREKNLKCDKCEYKTDYKHSLLSHLKSHERHNGKLKNLSAIKCEKSPSVLKNKVAFQSHLYWKHGTLQCDICGSKFAHKLSLRIHLIKVHLFCPSKNSPNVVKCEKCPSVLMSKKYYRRHLRIIHENREKPQCDACGFKFAHKYSLRRHFVNQHLK
jgi:KRAB domain-containing zinc finger protein